MNKSNILELRKRAENELRVIFCKPVTEENIMYLVGLYQMGVDTVGAAIAARPDDPMDLYGDSLYEMPELTEEQKLVKAWEKRNSEKF